MAKVICYLNPDGTLAICRPAANARLISRVGTEIIDPPVEAYHFFREHAWLAEAEAQNYVEFYETEDEFVSRIAYLDVPQKVNGTLKVVRVSGTFTSQEQQNADVYVNLDRSKPFQIEINPPFTGYMRPQDIFSALDKSKPHTIEDVPFWIIDEAEIPADRYFRNAWRHDNGKIAIDMPHARELHRDKIREARKPKLAVLDFEYYKADEAVDTAAKKLIAKKKQVLRDLTALPEIEAAATPEELKAIWPAELR